MEIKSLKKCYIDESEDGKKSKSVSKCDEKLRGYSQFVWVQVGDKKLGKERFFKKYLISNDHTTTIVAKKVFFLYALTR